MKSEFTAIIESVPEGGYWAICPEVPGAKGQGVDGPGEFIGLVAGVDANRAEIVAQAGLVKAGGLFAQRPTPTLHAADAGFNLRVNCK